MALARIRANNEEFRDANLAGAQIRVRGGLMQNPLHLDELNLRRATALRGGDSISNENRSEVLRDIMISDVLGRLRGRGDLQRPV